jgi:hypothetical protein
MVLMILDLNSRKHQWSPYYISRSSCLCFCAKVSLTYVHSGQSRKYEATDSDAAYLKQINYLSPVPAMLELTAGAQVMLAKNVDVSQGLVNGARGVVVGFEKGGEGKLIIFIGV